MCIRLSAAAIAVVLLASPALAVPPEVGEMVSVGSVCTGAGHAAMMDTWRETGGEPEAMSEQWQAQVGSGQCVAVGGAPLPVLAISRAERIGDLYVWTVTLAEDLFTVYHETAGPSV